MKRSGISQQIKSFIKNHPIKILVSGTGGISFFWGINKIIDLEYDEIIQILSNIKNIIVNNFAIIMVCICVIIIATYIFIFKIRKLKADESTNQEILKGFKNIINKNENLNDIDIRKNDDELLISINVQSKKNNSQPPNNLYTLKGNRKEIDTNKETKSN